MAEKLAVLAIILLAGMVLSRVLWLRRRGVEAVKFGQIDRTDFLLPPFALFYFYLVFANAFGWPTLSRGVLFQPGALQWLGVAFCLAAPVLMLWSLVSFGRSFRVGIDQDRPDELVTTGVFAYTRNPIYAAFLMLLAGQVLVFPNWILLVYLAAGAWVIHRQVLREEEFLKAHYGEAYAAYCRRVRRYL